MPSPVTFLHAADLHLERPLAAGEDVPGTLDDLLCDAPLRAARAVFDAAVAQQVDFLVLAGDVLDLNLPDRRAVGFLWSQLERCRAAGIPVFWAAGHIDRHWQGAYPQGTQAFPAVSSRVLRLRCAGRPRIDLVGRGYDGWQHIPVHEFTKSGVQDVAVAVAHGRAEERDFAGSEFDLWALGGRHRRHTFSVSRSDGGECLVHYPGTHQGRSPYDDGPRGYTVVEMQPGEPPRLRFEACDVVRYLTEQVTLTAEMTRTDLLQTFRTRLRGLVEEHRRALLVTWVVSGPGAMDVVLRDNWAHEALRQLRAQFGYGPRPAWSVAVLPDADDPVAVSDGRRLDSPAAKSSLAYRQRLANEAAAYQFSVPEWLTTPAARRAARTTHERLRLTGEAALLGDGLLAAEEYSRED